MPLNTPAKNVMLDALDESATQITHIGAMTLAGGAPGMGTNAAGTEAAGGSPAYARQSLVWGAAASELKSNTNSIAIDVPAGTYAFLPFYNASTGNTNNYRGYFPMGGSSAIKGFFSVDTTLSNDQLFSVGHGMSDGDRVILYAPFSDALPTGLTEETVYFVVNSATNSFKVSTTSGGSAVDITAVGGGEGYFQRVVPEVFAAQGQITIAAGALVLDASAI